MRRFTVILATLMLWGVASPAVAAELLEAGGIAPCTSPDDSHLIAEFDITGLRANKGIVQASENHRFHLMLTAAIFAQPPDPIVPPDPVLVSEIAPTVFGLDPAREDGLRGGSTVELATVQLQPPPDNGVELKRLLDEGHTLLIEVTATLILVDAAGATHTLDTALMKTSIAPAPRQRVGGLGADSHMAASHRRQVAEAEQNDARSKQRKEST